MSLPINESVWLATEWASHYFVMKRKRIYNWEEAIKFSIIEIETQDDDGVYEDFDNNYDYKEEWKEAVRYNDYEGSLEDFTEEVQQNYWDYVDSVLNGCDDQDIIDWVQDNVDCNYWRYNIIIVNEREITTREDWTFDNYILRELENSEDWEYEMDNSVFSDILCEYGKIDYQYMEI